MIDRNQDGVWRIRWVWERQYRNTPCFLKQQVGHNHALGPNHCFPRFTAFCL